jgi:hypothetical protein
MTISNSVLVWFPGGAIERNQDLARRLISSISLRGGTAELLSGSTALSAARAAGLDGDTSAPDDAVAGNDALAILATAQLTAGQPLIVNFAEDDAVGHVLVELGKRGLPTAVYTESEQEQVARRLEALGYID